MAPAGSMGNPKGGRYERELLDYLREKGHDAERLRLTGTKDEGDLLLRLSLDRRIVIEAKNRKQMNLAGWLEEASAEAYNYADHRRIDLDLVNYAVIHKRKGKGVQFSYVTLPLHEYLEQIK